MFVTALRLALKCYCSLVTESENPEFSELQRPSLINTRKPTIPFECINSDGVLSVHAANIYADDWLLVLIEIKGEVKYSIS
jgi:hypothetical protein